MKVKCINTHRAGLLTVGKEYNIVNETGEYITVINDGNNPCRYDKTAGNFEYVTPLLTLEEHIQKAKEFIGKTVISAGGQYKIDGVKVFIKGTEYSDCSLLCDMFAMKHGGCVALQSGKYNFPYNQNIVSSYVRIDMDAFTCADVYSDKVFIGGNTYTHAKIKELASLCK